LTYREAFAVAYARELSEVSKGGAALAGARWSLRLRYRAFRLARHHRRRARLQGEREADVKER